MMEIRKIARLKDQRGVLLIELGAKCGRSRVETNEQNAKETELMITSKTSTNNEQQDDRVLRKLPTKIFTWDLRSPFVFRPNFTPFKT